MGQKDGCVLPQQVIRALQEQRWHWAGWAKERGPFSGSDKYLEERKQRAEPLLGECLSFVFVTVCDTDSRCLSLRCVPTVRVFPSLSRPQCMWESNLKPTLRSTLPKLWCDRGVRGSEGSPETCFGTMHLADGSFQLPAFASFSPQILQGWDLSEATDGCSLVLFTAATTPSATRKGSGGSHSAAFEQARLM